MKKIVRKWKLLMQSEKSYTKSANLFLRIGPVFTHFDAPLFLFRHFISHWGIIEVPQKTNNNVDWRPWAHCRVALTHGWHANHITSLGQTIWNSFSGTNSTRRTRSSRPTPQICPYGQKLSVKKKWSATNGSHKWEIIWESMESVERNVNGLRQTDICIRLRDKNFCSWDSFEGEKWR